jgi:hypothetical protein
VSGTDEIQVPGPLPDEVKDTLGFPRSMRIMLDAVSPEPPQGLPAMLFHLEHDTPRGLPDLTTWGISWGAGWRIGLEVGESFTTKHDDGVPPAAIAAWVDAHWDRVVRGTYTHDTEARS